MRRGRHVEFPGFYLHFAGAASLSRAGSRCGCGPGPPDGHSSGWKHARKFLILSFQGRLPSLIMGKFSPVCIAEAARATAIWLIAAVRRVERSIAARAHIHLAGGIARTCAMAASVSRRWRQDRAHFSRAAARLVSAVGSAK